jgi:hypothetical protein
LVSYKYTGGFSIIAGNMFKKFLQQTKAIKPTEKEMTTRFKNFTAHTKITSKMGQETRLKKSAVIAYYAIFALPGLLVVIITLAGYFFDSEAVNGQITGIYYRNGCRYCTPNSRHYCQSHPIPTRFGQLSWNQLPTILVGATIVFCRVQNP